MGLQHHTYLLLALSHPQVVEDPWTGQPRRHPALLVRSDKPFNAETPPDILAAQLLTANDVFYVRGHLPVPDLKEEEYVLRVRLGGEEGAGLAGSSMC